MTSEQIIESIKESIVQGRADKNDEGIEVGMVGNPGVKELTQAAIQAGIDPEVIVASGISQGVKVVKELSKTREWFILDMLASIETVEAAMDILKPRLIRNGIKSSKKTIMATVQDDLRDIGESIISALVKGAGYTMNEWGLDMFLERIVDAIKEENPDSLRLLILLTTITRMMRETIEKLDISDLREIEPVVGPSLDKSAALAS